MPTINVVPDSTTELQQIADILAKSRKVVVVTGAGISTNCGIPDFRSEHGLYSMIQAQYDAALENPPWEMNDYDIDDRPKKKRRVTERYYYELVTADGVRVELPPEESSELPSEQPSQQCSRLASKELSIQAEAPPPSSRRSSRRHVSSAQDNTKNEISNLSLKGQTPQTEHDSPIQDNSVNEPSQTYSKSRISRARNISSVQSDSINEALKPPSKSENTRAQNISLAQVEPKNESPSSSWKSPPARTRPNRACDRCRVRKIKCGEVRPCCEPCSKAGSECITTENLKRRESRNGNLKSQEEITPSLEMDIDSESFNVEEKASQQLLQESSEYSSQYSSENSRLPEDVVTVDSNQKRARRSVRNISPLPLTSEETSIPTRNRSDSSLSSSLRRESSIRSTIQASNTNQQSISKSRNPNQKPSSQISSSSKSIIKSRSSSRQSTRSRADSLLSQPEQQSSLLGTSSQGNTPAFELTNSKLSSIINTENASIDSSATPSISSSDCSSGNKRNFLSEVSSITTASESEEPSTQSSQSSSRTLPNLKGKDLFDSVIWSDPFSTSIFYMFISNFRRRINNNVKSTTTTHKFIRALRDNGRLVRNYTQNIDCLEEREGLTTDLELGAGDRTRFQTKVQVKSVPSGGEGRGGKETSLGTGVECVLLHGSLRKLRCGVCSKLTSWDEDDRENTTMAGSAPDCPSCISSSLSRQDKGRRGLAVGRLRPDIVLYGEEHPHANLVGPLIIHDLKLGPDVLLILGTSLRVHGLKIMVKEFAQAVHARGGSVIFVNQTKLPESQWGDVIDYWVEWDCDAWVLDLKNRRSDIWQPYSNVTQSVANKDPPPSKQRNSSEKVPAYRPQCKRDDKTNAVYFTFKILDDLRKLKDNEGNGSPRPIYWQPFDRKAFRASTGQIQDQNTTKKSRPSILPIRKSRKSLPTSSSIKPSTVATNSKPEKDEPISENAPIANTLSIEPPRSGAWLGDRILKKVRRLTNNTLPESFFDDLRARMSLERLAETVPGNSIGYKRSFGDVGIDGGLEVIGLPNMRGLMDSKISIKGMSLASLPPTGSPGSGRKDQGKGKMVERGERASSPMDQNTIVVQPKPVMRHPYGTRSKRTNQIEGEENGDGNGGEGDTIVVRGRDSMRIGAVCNDR